MLTVDMSGGFLFLSKDISFGQTIKPHERKSDTLFACFSCLQV
jgi:hypothetical protein